MIQLTRNAVDVLPEGRLAEQLAGGRPLRVKLGIDPTTADIHLGHTVVLGKLAEFQRDGHTVVLIIGDFTARVGDPSGRSSARPLPSAEEIEANAATYQEQAFKLLDRDRTEVRFNSEWLLPLGSPGMIKLAAKYTLARMLERDDFKKRWAEGRPIALHELLYPLAQGYDSVALKADVELGSSDQLFNLLVGRTLQKEYGQEPQVCLTGPLLEGTDAREENGKIVGDKMSKSLGNYVGIDEPAGDQYGKLMSISDGLMWRYYELLSRRTAAQNADLRRGHPKAAKMALAREIVERHHGPEAARAAEDAFEQVHARREAPDEIEERELPRDPGAALLPLLKALPKLGLASSGSEARRLIAQGGVTVEGARVSDPNAALPPGLHLIKVGKRKFVRLHVR